MRAIRVMAAKWLVELAARIVNRDTPPEVIEEDDAPVPRVVVGKKAEAMLVAGRAVAFDPSQATVDAPLAGSLRDRMSRRHA